MLIDVLIEGVTPLLQRRFTDASAVDGDAPTRRVLVAQRTPREEATANAYVTPAGRYYLPGGALARLLREAGAGHKLKGSRRSLKYVIPAAVLVGEDVVPLLAVDGRTPIADFEVDSRPVTIPATKGRIMRHRPRFDAWAARFTLEIEDAVLPDAVVHEVLASGGRICGLGDFRPEKGGPFGRFRVTEWKRRR